MSLKFNFHRWRARDEAVLLVFVLFRDIDKSEEVINIDETPSNHRKEECEKITFDGGRAIAMNDSRHKRLLVYANLQLFRLRQQNNLESLWPLNN